MISIIKTDEQKLSEAETHTFEERVIHNRIGPASGGKTSMCSEQPAGVSRHPLSDNERNQKFNKGNRK